MIHSPHQPSTILCIRGKKPHLPALAGSRARDALAATAFTGGKLGTPNHPVLAKRGDWQEPCQHVEKVLWGKKKKFPAKKSKNSPKTVSKKQGIFWIWISEFGQKGSDLEISLCTSLHVLFISPSPHLTPPPQLTWCVCFLPAML